MSSKLENRSADHDKGLLSSIDGYMNLAMEKTKEHTSGSLRREYGDCFIRGNNGEIAFLLGLAGLTRSSHVYFSVLIQHDFRLNILQSWALSGAPGTATVHANMV